MATVSSDKPASTGAVERGRRHIFVGVVLSDKTDKTRVVTVERPVKHPKYQKIIRKRSKFYVHDEKNESHKGDLIEIMGARRISKLKRWRLVRVVKAMRVRSGEPSADAPEKDPIKKAPGGEE